MRNRALDLLGILVLLIILAGASSLAATGEPARGAVVEEVGPSSPADRAGLLAGDVLVSWSHARGSGQVETPFDVGRLALEEGGRGAVAFRGLRGGESREWTIPPGTWGLRTRPALPEDLLSLYREGRDRIASGDVEKGAPLWRSAADTAARRGDALRAAWLQARLARAYAEAGRGPEADAAWEEAVRQAEPAGPDAAAQLLRDWGEDLLRRNDWDRAVERYRRAMALGPEEGLAAASDWNALGVVASRRGDLGAAQELFGKAYALRERLAPGSLDLAVTERHLAVVAARRGDLGGAEQRFLKVLEIQERLAPESLEVSATLNNLGNVASIRGDLATAEERYRLSLILLERLAPDTPDLAMTLSNLGIVDMTRGDLAVAEGRFRRSLAIKEKNAPESLDVATDLNNLGVVAEKRGDFAAAEEHHRRALAIRAKVAPGSPYVSESLANLGVVARRQGDLDRADDYLRRALEIQDKVAPEGYTAALLITHRAITAVDRGDLALAEQLHGRAFAILEKLAPGSLAVSDSLQSLGIIAAERGDLVRAEELFRRSLAIREKLAPGSTRLGSALNNLGQVHHQAGRRDLAADHFCRATEAFDRQRGKLGGTTEGKSAYGITAAEPYRDCVAALIDTGRPEEAFHTLERGRARAFLDLLADRDLKWTTDLPPELARERQQTGVEYDRTQASLSRLSPSRNQAEIDRLLVRLRELRVRQEEIAARVRQASPRAAELHDPRPLDLAAARSALDPGTLLLAWSVGEESSFLFVVQPAGAASSPGTGLEIFPLPLGDEALQERVESFRNLLLRAGSDRAALSAQARELYDLLLRPADTRIAAAERLLVSPDGPLHILPFAALVRDGRYLAEQKPVHTILSATVYAELKRSRREAPRPVRLELAAFGDPRYPALPPGQAPAAHPEVRAAMDRGLALTPLPSTRDEVRGIAAFFPEARTFLGAEATEERAKSIGKDARYLHFACHGLLDERFPLSSALALTIPENPADGQDNGLLQAWEILESMRLDADLVTLSACDTALGQEMGGEGLLGLTRAFQYAGARSVLASLWSVSDASTGDLMKRFYGHLRAGRSKDEALQAAQAELIRSAGLSHPYHWAAFQLFGDWR